jgi:cardiolipin synthase
MTLLTDVRPAFNLLVSELEHARKNINMELFIIRDDQTGRHFKNVLIRKAQQGVEVRLLYDAWGSAFTSKSYFNDLRRNGVKVAAYNPLLSGFLQGRLGNRLHRKIIVIDGKQAFIGGENIGDEYLGKNNKIGFWKDTGIIYQGDAALAIQQLFLNDWLQASREKITGKSFYPSTSGLMPNMVRVISGGPDSPLTNMSLTYARLVNKAQDQVLITSPYYFPDKAMAQALYKAVQRKVTVHLILPRKSDHKLTRLAQPYYINQLISHGIKVSTYNRGFIHSKIMIIDNQAASIGSANLDRFSFYRNYEVNSIIYNKDVITQLQQDFTRTLKDSTTLASKQ